jgi:hypothetical protein
MSVAREPATSDSEQRQMAVAGDGLWCAHKKARVKLADVAHEDDVLVNCGLRIMYCEFSLAEMGGGAEKKRSGGEWDDPRCPSSPLPLGWVGAIFNFQFSIFNFQSSIPP